MSRPGTCLRCRWCQRDLRAGRAALVRRLARRPAARFGRRLHPGPGQGVRRRSAAAFPAPRRRRRPRAAAGRAPPGCSVAAPRAAARDLGLEPLVEAHDERELDAALATDARIIGINNRDLRTLTVDPERAERLRALVPDDRIVIAESGVREPGLLRRWRALGFDGALVGEELMRTGSDPSAVRARVAAMVEAGRPPSAAEDPAAADRGRS